ncbi:TetR/AcrR family transcriptional regulator [Embleya sp. NBC_00896]|uniref:TetR/AcrR family transcriptional regulator n=1 Tax=Embleya sp. NBC_00896 TaxID=2975961 RepID=UPI00386E0481|nr:TetR/AcrR family transcriptional regulator [Embleya sp. NBC_00896]
MERVNRGSGRARDSAIDARILAAARRHLSRDGYAAMSIAAVAQEAGTTRQALYRRWAGKAELAAAVVAELGAEDGVDVTAEDPFSTLVAELVDFERGVSRPGRLSLVGTMLQDTTDPDLRARYRARVIAPRRARLLAAFEAARLLGHIDPDADLEIALTMCTGAWYGRELAGAPAPADWPRRTAALVWRAMGGTVPARSGAGGADGKPPHPDRPADQV